MRQWFNNNLHKILAFNRTGIPVTLIMTFSYYPVYYGYLQYRGLVLRKDFNKEMIYEISDIKKEGNFKGGFNLFFLHKMFPVLVSLFLSPIPLLRKLKFPLTLIASIYTYVYFINSNLKALNLKGEIPAYSIKDIKDNILKKETYKGLFYHGIVSILIIFPFINYLCFKYETLRLTYTLGPYYGHNFQTYKDCKKYLDDNDLYEYGRSRYNFYVNFYNLFAVLFLLRIFTKGKNVNLLKQKKIIEPKKSKEFKVRINNKL